MKYVTSIPLWEMEQMTDRQWLWYWWKVWLKRGRIGRLLMTTMHLLIPGMYRAWSMKKYGVPSGREAIIDDIRYQIETDHFTGARHAQEGKHVKHLKIMIVGLTLIAVLAMAFMALLGYIWLIVHHKVIAATIASLLGVYWVGWMIIGDEGDV